MKCPNSSIWRTVYLFSWLFSILNFVWLIFYNFFSKKLPAVFSSIMYILGRVYFAFLITRTWSFLLSWSADQFAVQLFTIFLIFCYLHTITNFEFEIFVIMLPTIFSICAPKNIRKFYFRGSLTCFVVLSIWHSICFIMCISFETTVACL